MMRRRRGLLVILVLVLVIMLGIVFHFRGSITESVQRFVFLKQYDAANQTVRESVAQKYLPILGAQGMIDALQDQNPLCHSEAHPVGRVIFRETQNLPDSLRMCGSGCSYGCFHGILMEMFSTNNDTLGGALVGDTASDTLQQIIQSAPTFCSRVDVSAVVMQWTCLHGLGHVIMYLSHYDIPKAVAICNEFPSKIQTSICEGGAFMEYLRSDTNKEAASQPTLFPCDAIPDAAKPCFVYKGEDLVKAFGSPAQAIAACHAAPKNIQLACIRGVGVGGTKLEMLQKDGGLDSVCGTLTGRERAACIDGAVVSVVFKMDVLAKPCSTVAAAYQPYCDQEYAILQTKLF